jgi:hypothetical protein
MHFAAARNMLSPIVLKSTLTVSVALLIVSKPSISRDVVLNAIPDSHRGRRYRRHGSSHSPSWTKSQDNHSRAIPFEH